jgi:hypothetical protein
MRVVVESDEELNPECEHRMSGQSSEALKIVELQAAAQRLRFVSALHDLDHFKILLCKTLLKTFEDLAELDFPMECNSSKFSAENEGRY